MNDDLIGKSLGQFEIIEEVGRGGMASVYRARQTSINRIVAIKVLPKSLLHDPSFYERFTREVALVAHLEHPHILPIHDYGEVDGTPYIAMRYLAGGSMAEWIRRGLPPLDKLAKPISQVAAALDYAHQEGVIHRDVKPGNILLDENGNAYLSDFGIARVLDSNLTGSAIIGTPAYMSPEQANGLPLDARSDIYSLGVVLYELVTGQEPFEAETPVALLLKHINDPMPAARILRPELPIAAERVILKATAKRPEDRYPSASSLADAFAAALYADTHALAVDEKNDADQPTLFDPDSLLRRIPTHPANQPTPPQEQPLTTPVTATDAAGTRPAATLSPKPSGAAEVYEATETAQRQNVPSVPQELNTKQPRRFSIIMASAGVIAVLAIVIGLGASALNNSGASLTQTPSLTQPPASTPNQAALTSDLPGSTNTAEATQLENILLNASPEQTETSTTTAAAAGISGMQGQIAFVSSRDGNNEIYVMNLDATGIRNLTNNPARDEYPSWSPDGSRIAFMSYRDDPSSAVVYIMDADGSNLHRLTDETTYSYYPAWSPDGTQLALTVYTDEGNAQISIVDADGKNLRPVSNLPKNVGLATWSPDSKTIAFMSDENGNHEVYKINIDGTGLRNLTNNSDEDARPAWSPTSDQIVFQHNRANDNPAIYVMDSTGGSLRRVNDNFEDGYDPTWSPDGTLITFASYHDDGQEIYIMNADGTNVRRVTDSSGDNTNPVWRPYHK